MQLISDIIKKQSWVHQAYSSTRQNLFTQSGGRLPLPPA